MKESRITLAAILMIAVISTKPGAGPVEVCHAATPVESAEGGPSPSSIYDEALDALKNRDYAAAEIHLRQLLSVHSRYQEPSGRSAWYQLARTLELQGEKLAAMRALEEGRDTLQAAAQADWYLMYDLARLYAENQVPEYDAQITELVYDVLGNSSPERQPDLWQRLFHETAFLLDPPEQTEFERSLTEPGGRPGRVLLRFFRLVDPSPLTRANEYLRVFFQRSAQARQRYPHNLSPRGFDARGEIFVKLGRPYSIVSNHTGVRGDVGWAIYPYEVWFYKQIHPDLYYTFIRKRGRSHYTLAEGPESVFGTFYDGRRTFFNRQNVGQTALYLRDEVYTSLAGQHEVFRRRLYELGNQLSVGEALEYAKLHFSDDDKGHVARRDSIAPPAVYRLERRKVLPLSLSMANFREEAGRTRVEFYYSVPYESLYFSQSPAQAYLARVHAKIGLFNDDHELIAADSIRADCRVSNLAATQRGNFASQWNVVLDPGKYSVYLSVEDSGSDAIGVRRTEFEARGFPADSLSLSDIQLSPEIRRSDRPHRFVKNGFYVVPFSGSVIEEDQPLFAYFEIYNLSVDNEGQASYRIDYRVVAPERKKGLFAKLGGLFGGKGRTSHRVAVSTSRTGKGSDQAEAIQLDLGEFSGGNLRLEIVVTDLISGQQASSTVAFELAQF